MFVLSQSDAIKFRENLDPGSLAHMKLTELLLLKKTDGPVMLTEDVLKAIGQFNPNIYNHLERD